MHDAEPLEFTEKSTAIQDEIFKHCLKHICIATLPFGIFTEYPGVSGNEQLLQIADDMISAAFTDLEERELVCC